MKLGPYVSFCLILTVVWMQLYAKTRETFNGVSEYRAQIHHLENELEQRKVQALIEADHFLEFRQYVATLMPDVLKQKGMGEAGYPFRSLASTISPGRADEIRKTLAKTLFEKGKDLFRKGKFSEANRAFKQVIDKFGFSPNIVETYFLIAEGHFQSENYEESVTVIQQMVELFPNHELTGFAMVRLGRIYEMQNRNEEAVDIYKTVLRSFPQRDVAAQARSSMRGMEL
jgi:TolA-binding protein